MQDIERVPPMMRRTRPTTWRGPSYEPIKRQIDLLVTVLLLLVFGLPMLLIALAIKLHSPGPIFYHQQRIGKNGVPFDMLKFRSMRVGNDDPSRKKQMQRLIKDNLGPQQLGAQTLKVKNDARVTGVGKVLRKAGLDELPQLFNVLRGEMSLVGPRPPLPYEYEVYQDWHKDRLAVLPGITGLWQTTAHNLVPFDEMVRIDLRYIETMNPWLDFKIMVCTPVEMLRGKGGG